LNVAISKKITAKLWRPQQLLLFRDNVIVYWQADSNHLLSRSCSFAAAYCES